MAKSRVKNKHVKPADVSNVEASDLGFLDQNEGWINGKYIFKLTHPIKDGGDDLNEITLREPLASDSIEAGIPCELDPTHNPPRVIMHEKKLAAMISRLANITPYAVGKMHPKDFTSIGWILAGFFIPV